MRKIRVFIYFVIIDFLLLNLFNINYAIAVELEKSDNINLIHEEELINETKETMKYNGELGQENVLINQPEEEGKIEEKQVKEFLTKSSENKQTIKDGYYVISSAINENKVLDISAASKDNCANVQIWENVNVKQQKFKVTYNGDGYYTIQNILSNKVLDVANGIGKSGNNVWQYEANKSKAQCWTIKMDDDGYYYIISALNDLYLDLENGQSKNGTNIQISKKDESKAQKFKLIETDVIIGKRTIEDGYYSISTKLNQNKVIDVSGASKNNCANIQIWENVNANQQKFKITYKGDGYYTIQNVLSNKVLDVENGNGYSGANVWQYENNNTNAQKWIIFKDTDGYYYIISALNDLFLDVSNAETKNGTNIQVYTGNKSNAQKFKLNKTEVPKRTINDGLYRIEMLSKRNMVLDIDGAKTSNGANVQVWTYEKVPQQKFMITYNGDGYYTVRSLKSGKVLDVANGNGTDGANVQQFDRNSTNAQKWIIKDLGWGIYNIISACNDKFLTVAEEDATCGTNVEINKENGNNSQKFVFEKEKEIKLQSGTYGSTGLKVKGDYFGQNLKYYKIGNGPNVFFATFAIHGWEDCFDYDGKELTKIAESFKDKLIDMQDEALANKWTIYILPSLNPDGEYYGWTHNGPGRTTLYSAAPGNKGIDMNRCWSTGFRKYTGDRNYNGTEAFQAYEARDLRDFLLNHKATNGQTVLVDLHGWLNETIGDDEIGSYYRSQFGMSKHIATYGQGYLVNWARSNLGSNGRVARSSLVELPEVSNSSQVSNWGFADKYINATLNMLRGI